MRTQKNQIALAELKFSYQALKKPLDVATAQSSYQLLAHLRNGHFSNDKLELYVMFLNEKQQAFSWYELTGQKLASKCLNQMVGLAVASGAHGILILSYCDNEHLSFHKLDEYFVQSCFNICVDHKIEIIDYIICSPNNYLSLREHYKR